jgi:hypothetical protein
MLDVWITPLTGTGKSRRRAGVMRQTCDGTGVTQSQQNRQTFDSSGA